jgi:hypothetical protein
MKKGRVKDGKTERYSIRDRLKDREIEGDMD